MIVTAARIAANRRNACKSTGPRTAEGKLRAAANAAKSTGPRTAAGKARSARNALRHGLSRPASADPNSAAAILELTQAIAGGHPRLHAGALMFAAARLDIQRVRAAQRPLHASIFANLADCKEAVRRLGATDYYERLARRREKLAIVRLEQAICENEPKPLCENEPNPIPSPRP
jgi:hypothetical protein